MTGRQRMMRTPFTQLTTLKNPETQEGLIKVWRKLPICTKMAFASFAMAKVSLLFAFCLMMVAMTDTAIIVGILYGILVWTSAFLAIYDWLKYYMEEDLSLPNLFELDFDETSQ